MNGYLFIHALLFALRVGANLGQTIQAKIIDSLGKVLVEVHVVHILEDIVHSLHNTTPHEEHDSVIVLKDAGEDL